MELALDRLQIDAEPEALQMIARAAEGAMRDAWSILDMAVSAAVNDRITMEIVRDILGAADKDFLFGFADVLAAAGRTRRDGADRPADPRRARGAGIPTGDDPPSACAADRESGPRTRAAALLQITEEDEKRYRKQAAKFSQERLIRMMNDSDDGGQ